MTTIGGAIPAMPLLLNQDRSIAWDEQAALVGYYLDSGVDGMAVGVHTTQFELHHDRAALRDLWALVRDVVADRGADVHLAAGICGSNQQASEEAALAAELGYRSALLCSNGMDEVTEATILDKAAVVGQTLPTVGFYLQDSVGGMRLTSEFWLALCEQESCIGIKAAPFDRYRTGDVAQAILESDRWRDVSLLTGNDDAIVADLVTPHTRTVAGEERRLRCSGGLLGQFAVGTGAAVRLTRRALATTDTVPLDLLAEGSALTEVNAAVFDVANNFRGCVAGVNEVLRQQGRASTSVCLSDNEQLSPGQAELIEATRQRYPTLLDEPSAL